MKEVDYSIKDSELVFEGKRIEFVDGEIIIMDGKNSSEPIAVAEFMRRPGVGFRRVIEKWKKT